jgi:hypothetical protein
MNPSGYGCHENVAAVRSGERGDALLVSRDAA